MADKTQELITKYLGDMIALESHIVQALDKQASWLNDHAEIKAKVATYRTNMAKHVDTLKARLTALGGSPTHPVKEGVASVFGVAAGVVDKMRGSEAAKDLRDDYSALNLSLISYIMLYTTALAAQDQETASLCRTHLQDNAQFVLEINNIMPQIVFDELRQDGMTVDDSAIQAAQLMNHEVWSRSAHA
jgi:ferritin-like metal-binding protein YciE